MPPPPPTGTQAPLPSVAVTPAVVAPPPPAQPQTYTELIGGGRYQESLSTKCAMQASTILKQLMATDLNRFVSYPVHEVQKLWVFGHPHYIYFYATADFKATDPQTSDRALLQFNTRINGDLIRNEDQRLVQHPDGGGIVRSHRDRNSDEGFWVRAWELQHDQPIAVKCYVYNKADGKEFPGTRYFIVSVEHGIREVGDEEYEVVLESLK